jgi:uncharacterized protein (TIGR03118 family)
MTKNVTNHYRTIPAALAATATCFVMTLTLPAATVYLQTNLASDIPALTPARVDPSLKNPWGMSFGPTTPFWVSNQGSGNATLYNGLGVAQALIVAIPPTSTIPPQGPTGQVFANIPGNFIDNGAPAIFIFDTLAGTIAAWNSTNGTTAVLEHVTGGATYTGLALDNNGSGNFLYAANFASGHIDAFDSTFAPATLPGSFSDPSVPAGFSPYAIQNVGGNLFVEYAQRGTNGRPVAGAGLGFVRVFNANGNLVLGAPAISGGKLNVPWGVTMAPANFGDFSSDLLVGNFGDGTINAFDPVTGASLGTLQGPSGQPIVNSGLWTLAVRTGGPSVNTNAVYFTAGINNEADGLFASIQVAPEPGTIAAAGTGMIALIRCYRRKRRA